MAQGTVKRKLRLHRPDRSSGPSRETEARAREYGFRLLTCGVSHQFDALIGAIHMYMPGPVSDTLRLLSAGGIRVIFDPAMWPAKLIPKSHYMAGAELDASRAEAMAIVEATKLRRAKEPC